MDLVNYLGLKVHITLVNEYYYSGVVIEADELSLTLIDKRGKKVSLSKNSIATIRELSK
jgi:hypothetical protein